MLEEKIIKDKLEEAYLMLKNLYSEDCVFGVFIYGPVNYHTAIDQDDIQIEGVYIPTFEEMCLGKPLVNGEINGIKVIDIRNIVNLSEKENHEMTEALYSEYIYVNPKFKNHYDVLLRNYKEILSNAKKETRIASAAAQALKYLDLFKNNPDDVDSLYKGVRLYTSCDLHLKGEEYKDCIFPKDPLIFNSLWNLKNNPEFLTPQQRGDLFETASSFCTKWANDIDYTYDEAGKEILIKNIIEIIRSAVMDKPDLNTFYDRLTFNEKKALTAILDTINIEGNISISKLTKSTGVSRPVFTSLITKMNNYKVAEITNNGVKGTHIRFVDSNILKMRL